MGILAALLQRSTPAPDFGERRRAGRRSRTRLRPGKLLDAKLGFLADCAIIDRSATGARVRWFGEWPEADGAVAVFDENERCVRRGCVAWRTASEAGVSLEPAAVEMDPRTFRRIAGPYYAVAD